MIDSSWWLNSKKVRRGNEVFLMNSIYFRICLKCACYDTAVKRSLVWESFFCEVCCRNRLPAIECRNAAESPRVELGRSLFMQILVTTPPRYSGLKISAESSWSEITWVVLKYVTECWVRLVHRLIVRITRSLSPKFVYAIKGGWESLWIFHETRVELMSCVNELAGSMFRLLQQRKKRSEKSWSKQAEHVNGKNHFLLSLGTIVRRSTNVTLMPDSGNQLPCEREHLMINY